MTPHVRLLVSCLLVGLLVRRRSVIKGREVTLPCSYRNPCEKYTHMIYTYVYVLQVHYVREQGGVTMKQEKDIWEWFWMGEEREEYTRGGWDRGVEGEGDGVHG